MQKESLRLLVGIAAEYNLEIDHTEFKTAFLNEQPNNFVNEENSKKISLLQNPHTVLTKLQGVETAKIHEKLLDLGHK